MNIEELGFEELNELAHETGDFEHIVKWELDEFFEMLKELDYDPQNVANMIFSEITHHLTIMQDLTEMETLKQ